MGGRVRAFLAAGIALAALGLAGLLVWRIALVSGEAARGETPAADSRKKKTSTKKSAGSLQTQAGQGTNVTLRYFDKKTGKLVLIVKAAKATIKGANCRLKDVRLKRILGGGRGVLLATSRSGDYNRKTGSGKLEGGVLVERLPAGQKYPDVTITGESLAWDHASETLSSEVRVEVVWRDRPTGRTLSAAGLGMVAERWGQKVRLEEDVRVSITAPALPGRLNLVEGTLGRAAKAKPSKKPVQTVLTSEGPATLEYDTALGYHRAVFNRGVVVRREGMRLSCDELEMLLCSDGSGARGGASPEVRALRSAGAAPLALPAVSRWLAASLRPSPRRAPAPSGKEGAKKFKGAGLVDLIIARGTVVVRAPEGVARGDLAWYDHPAGILWLEGREDEMAEFVRSNKNKDQVLANKIWFDTHTGNMGMSRVTITAEE